MSSATAQNNSDDLLAYAKEVIAYLNTALNQETETLTQPLQLELEENLRSFGIGRLKTNAKTRKELDASARQIWNLCVQHTTCAADKILPTLPECRLLSCYILETTRLHAHKSNNLVDEIRYISGLYLKLAEYCLATSDVKNARLALCKMADTLDRGEHGTHVSLQDMQRAQLRARMVLALQEDRCDLADHLYDKLGTLSNDKPILASTIQLCEIIVRIGSRYFQQGDFKIAAVWLRRGVSQLTDIPHTSLAPNQLSLKVAIIELAVKAIIFSKDPHTFSEAFGFVTTLRSAIGDSSVVLQLEMDMLLHDPDFPNTVEKKSDRIRLYLKNVKMGNRAVATFLHCMAHISITNPKLAAELLGEAIETMASTDSPVGIGTTIICLIETIGKMDVAGNHAQVIKQSLDACSKGQRSFKPAIVSRIRKLLWNYVGTAFRENLYNTIEDWCLLAEQPLLKGIIKDRCWFQRKRLQARIEFFEPKSMLPLCSELLEHEQNDPVVYVQMVGVALYLKDISLCTAAVEAIAKANFEDCIDNILYACVGEAIGLDMIEWFTTTFAVVVSGLASAEPAWPNAASVLQCAARLAMHIRYFEEDNLQPLRLATKIYREAATCHGNSIVFSPAQVDWFRDTAYNLAIATNDKSIGIELFECCYEFASSSRGATDTQLARMHCAFAVCALVSKSFTKDKNDEHDVTSTICLDDLLSSYFCDLQSLDSALSGSARHDLYKKASTLCMLRLRQLIEHDQWGAVPDLLKQASNCKDVAVLKAMGDCILRSGANASVTNPLLHRLVNNLHVVEPIGAIKFGKYLRCLVQVAMSAGDEAALPLLNQATQTAEELVRIGSNFPTDELQWLVATSFNKAIDHWERDDEKSCDVWAERAMKLASHAGDGGSLHATLEDRLTRMKTHNKEESKE